jgi:hypothetical protein
MLEKSSILRKKKKRVRKDIITKSLKKMQVKNKVIFVL